MLDRLLRGLVGDKPVEFGRRIMSAVTGPELTPLAERVLDHYKHTVLDPIHFHAATRSFTEELLRNTDPVDLVASLVISLPVAHATAARADGTRSYQLWNGYQWTMCHSMDQLETMPVQDWRLSDQQISAALTSYQQVILADPHQGLARTSFLAGIMRRAASGGPVLRAALIAFLDATLQGQKLGASQFRKLVEENLPALGVAREEIPTLALWAVKSREVQLRRDLLVADAGPLLGPVLEHVLDGGKDLYHSRSHQSQALQNLFGADARARGKAFSHLLDIIVTSSGYNNLQALARHNGFFSHELEPPARTIPWLDTLAIEMSKSKMELADPDRDHARLIFLLTCKEHYRTETSRLILKQLLKTAQAHPGGQTAQALKQLIGHSAYVVWAADVREVLRDGAHHAGSDPEKAANLPPIELPDFRSGDYTELRKLEEHFGSLLEPRLYDRVHSDYLEGLARLSYAIEAVPEGDGRVGEVGRLIGAAGLHFNASFLRDRTSTYVPMVTLFIERGRMLHELRGAFRPLVESQPDATQKLASLTHQIEKRSAPSAKWQQDVRVIWETLPQETRLDHLRRIVEVASPFIGHFGVTGEAYLRTMIYASASLPAADVGPMLTDFALKQCYVTREGIGMRSEKLGNACLWVLAELPDGAGVPYLARILARVKYPKVKSKIDTKLNEAAHKAGIGRAELDEISVPTHGLGRDGTRHVAFEQGKAVFRVARNSAKLEWFDDAGKQLKSPSKAMKDEKGLFKEVQADLKELNADLAIQPQRLQHFYLQPRAWPADIWRSRYLDHPLMRGFARKLVWWIDGPDGQSAAALPDDAGESLLDVAGNRVSLDGATVRLWHPMDAEVAAVEAWRDRLEALQVTQSFAQVWREVYALTDAERATGTYSNRWAAHILKQHQAMTLARLNGWRVTHRMWVDAANDEPWHLVIPAYNLVADYWVKGAGGDDPQVSGSAAYAYVSTDRVQFHRVHEGAGDSANGPRRGDPVALTEIPPVVFSEIMRHADLFTAVASIAADPDWLDRGRDADHPNQWARHAQDYWLQTNTATLVESGKRRRAMLERIVPRLKIAPLLKLEDRYLVVRGTWHEYEIHLGSGACSRGGRHICIVPKSSAEGDRIWLPFEGDRTLSIIISKALLLAADDKITDPVILRQL
ncbi:hypothetical protein GGD63_005282 [Bradyrhizobium sp. cir1]|uniref:DUF4132 domain-containing protein n=1 Tax=Bradyrhizobium sp. cir1 TaxID=1445730 RepID=UPI00160646FC|nr:DUF4132 domain-containing protein [Bradyrhizobium sp. cir1]MBB4372474.1 hypothetical protein [Bradyrhizobium sp. cir1]